MARLEFFVVSRAVSIDQSTNYASILEILEVIQSESFPAMIPQCVATSLWRQEPGDEEKDYQLLLKVFLPSGETHEVRTNFRFGAHRHRVMQRIYSLPVHEAGQIRFEAVLNGEHAAEHVVDVIAGQPIDTVASPS